MPSAAPDQVLGRVVLVSGNEEFLAERRVGEIRAAVRRSDAEAEQAETTGDQLTLGTLGELSAPSLFSSTRCVVVRRLEDVPEESVAGLLAYAESPAEDIALVLVHSGGPKGTGVLTKLRKLPTVSEHKVVAPKAHELPGFVLSELRALKVRMDSEAAELLVQAVGANLRGLAAAAAQLANDLAPEAAGRSLGIEQVRQYFGGRAEAKSYLVAEHVLGGKIGPALEELRWGLDQGMAPVLVTSAMASSVRQLAGVLSAPRGARSADLVRDLGIPSWKLDRLRAQARGWEPEGLAGAITVVARADADIKGQAHDPDYALERMVITVGRLRRG